jgi:hypothetical protein
MARPFAGSSRESRRPLFLLLGLSAAATWPGPFAQAQPHESLSGESAAQSMKQAAETQASQYQLRWGPVGFQAGARVLAGYTDNVFYSQNLREDDVVINPEVTLGAFFRVSELNTLRLAVGIGYEYYTQNSDLNSDAPLINPDSELAFHVFIGDVHLRLREKFSYQETLFYNTGRGRQDLFYNFTDVGRFSRWDNLAGFSLDWDLNRVLLAASFEHENFTSNTERFDYLTRASEWLTASAAVRFGDQLRAGPEGQINWHNFDTETVMNDNWRARVGPFVSLDLREKLTLRAGGGYEVARYDGIAESSDVDTYYAYARISQETRLFSHSLAVGREHFLGDNANNLKSTYVRYSIDAPVLRKVDLGASAAVHFAEEFGGASQEDFTFFVFGVQAGYQWHKHWRSELAYELLLKDSETPLRDYHRNRVTLSLAFSF